MNTLSGFGARWKQPGYELPYQSKVTLASTAKETVVQPYLWMPVIGILLLTAALVILANQLSELRREAQRAADIAGQAVEHAQENRVLLMKAIEKHK